MLGSDLQHGLWPIFILLLKSPLTVLLFWLFLLLLGIGGIRVAVWLYGGVLAAAAGGSSGLRFRCPSPAFRCLAVPFNEVMRSGWSLALLGLGNLPARARSSLLMRARLCGAALVACGIALSPLQAQTIGENEGEGSGSIEAPPAEQFAVTEGGVDMRTCLLRDRPCGRRHEPDPPGDQRGAGVQGRIRAVLAQLVGRIVGQEHRYRRG